MTIELILAATALYTMMFWVACYIEITVGHKGKR